MNKILIMCTLAVLSGCAHNSLQSGSGGDDSGKENNSLFTFRNIQSGFMLYNALDQKGRETTGWAVEEVDTPLEAQLTDQSGWIIIRNPGTDQCLGSPDGRVLMKMKCTVAGNKTMFSFIPSTTGAVQIKSVPYGTCVSDSKDNGLTFPLGKCIADPGKPYEVVPQMNLWMLNPPNLKSPVL
ncbi:TPA: toxin [Salmonella enterica subsp. enterica serovar Reading]|nr:toxin [Salmonella enterica]EBS3610839.1 toxin [Salmonella enterica subsp. enterica serovar Poona]EBU6211243.1 toxin [Salmonella enterica subsp. enterica]EDM1743937.1 toxin [Salmonella enterica subsp. enterica serovar Muenchen]EGB1030956.1 toxin [Salmonella enterica subsp. enterica serovar Reading]